MLLLQGYDLDDAEEALDHVGGRLRVAIDHLAKANTPALADGDDLDDGIDSGRR